MCSSIAMCTSDTNRFFLGYGVCKEQRSCLSLLFLSPEVSSSQPQAVCAASSLYFLYCLMSRGKRSSLYMYIERAKHTGRSEGQSKDRATPPRDPKLQQTSQGSSKERSPFKQPKRCLTKRTSVSRFPEIPTTPSRPEICWHRECTYSRLRCKSGVIRCSIAATITRDGRTETQTDANLSVIIWTGCFGSSHRS